MKKLLFLALVSVLFFTSYGQETINSDQKDSLDLMIGQMIMVGLGDFNTMDQQAPVYKDIRSGKVGGVILFEKNLANKNTVDNLKKILAFTQSQSETPLFVSIDEEGGRVNRLKTRYGFPKTVTAQYLGTLDNLDSTSFYAKQTAGILYQLGVNMNFAPSVDVNINPENPVIGKIGRSFSEDPLVVAKHAQAWMEGHDLFGVATVLKHFPGHGSSKNDSHLGLTDVSSTWRFEELTPYRALLDSGKVHAIMTAHIVNDVLDDSKLPATLSDKVISDVLRGFMGYDGVVVSDDMQMKAISAQYPLDESIKMAILAGVDILLFANNVPDYELVTAEQIHQIIKKLIENGDISRERIAQSYNRIISLKKDMGLLK